MKILFLIPSLRAGGAERVVAILSNCLAQDISLNLSLLTFDSPENDFYKLSDHVERYSIGMYSCIRKGLVKKISSNITRLFRIKKILASLKPDVIVAFMPEMNILALLASLFTGIPVIISECTYPPYYNDRNFFDLIRKLLYKLCAAFVAPSKSIAVWATAFLNESCVSVIPNPVQFLQASNLKKMSIKGQKIILAVGRLVHEKGFDILINAYYRLYKDYPQWKLLIVGEGEERANLEKQITKLKLNKNITLAGQVTNVDKYYASSEIFVLSSRVEGFSNVLLEAMGNGLPVISFDCKVGPSDIIKDGKNGLLVPEGNMKQLSETMKMLIDSIVLRRKLSKEAREVAIKYSAENIRKQWINLLKSITVKNF